MDSKINNIKNIVWNDHIYNEFIDYLISIKDEKYKIFQSKLIPNNTYKMIGIRIPILRKIAKHILKTNYDEFIKLSKNIYLEEVLLNAIIISNITDREKQINYIKRLIPYLNNWCLCDTFCTSMKCVKKDLEFYYSFFTKYNSRMKIVIYLNYYLSDKYIDRVFNEIENINSDDYYIKMAISWLLCEAYVNYEHKVNNFLDKCNDKEIINMTKSKIRDSKKIK